MTVEIVMSRNRWRSFSAFFVEKGMKVRRASHVCPGRSSR
jgi:hypothetical protein